MRFNVSQQLKFFGKIVRKSLTHLIYPAKCLHCYASMDPEAPFLCDMCAIQLQLIDPYDHCSRCMQPNENLAVCQTCLQQPYPFKCMGAAFDYAGPAATLVKQLKYSNQTHLACGMAAFLFIQFERLAWPMPDIIIPVPISRMHALERGYNQSALLAIELNKFLKISIDMYALKRSSGDFSQAVLTLEKRKMLNNDCFKLHKNIKIRKKKVLMIDDVTTSGSTLKRCAEALSIGEPADLYALTFCHTQN